MPAALDKQLLSLSLQELTEVVQKLGEAPYRARQLFTALHAERVGSVDAITTLPSALRRQLSEAGYSVGRPRLHSRFTSVDGTVRYLFEFGDGQTVETVWMPEGDGGERGDTEDGDQIPASVVPVAAAQRFVVLKAADTGESPVSTRAEKDWSRATICVSSQVGCAVDCQFCLTAKLGIIRNLAAGEIAGQVLSVLDEHGVNLERDRINLVFMGQGEPLHNYQEWIKAVRLLVEGAGIPESRMTVSTAGILPRIVDLGREKVRPKLAISLNAPNDEIRAAIMPINRKWDIASLLAAAKAFPLRARERLTFEYVLLGGVNDAPEHAQELARQVRSLRAKVNLIAWNPGPDVPFSTPTDARVLQFQQTLIAAGVPAFIRRPRGRDIYAACGQLRRMAG